MADVKLKVVVSMRWWWPVMVPVWVIQRIIQGKGTKVIIPRRMIVTKVVKCQH